LTYFSKNIKAFFSHFVNAMFWKLLWPVAGEAVVFSDFDIFNLFFLTISFYFFKI